MATSPREELVIESIITFAKFDTGWVWSETDCASNTLGDSGHGSFKVLDDAVADFLEDRGLSFSSKPIKPEDAHYSELHKVDGTEDQYEIRKYRHGAPDPIQAVSYV